MAAYGIGTPLTSLYDQNERQKSREIMASLNSGANVAYVSDAGTPGLSDPGFVLINHAIAEGIAIVPIPGPSAVVTALSVSGLPMNRFLFQGFLPPKTSRRRQLLTELARETATLVFYESPNRLRAALEDMADVMGNRRIVLSRELTKMYEEILRGTVHEILMVLEGRNIKGEVTVIVEGCRDVEEQPDEAIIARLGVLLSSGDMSRRDIIEQIAHELKVSRQRVYRLAIKLDI